MRRGKQAVSMIDGRFGTEASGGITRRTLWMLHNAGLISFSMGGMRTPVKSMDISFKGILEPLFSIGRKNSIFRCCGRGQYLPKYRRTVTPM